MRTGKESCGQGPQVTPVREPALKKIKKVVDIGSLFRYNYYRAT